jgi:glycosyltransferase involved in cell wall biosynthesis
VQSARQARGERKRLSLQRKYICAFRGRRDYYQVPIALAEADLLEEFVTDAYSGHILRSCAGILPERLKEKVRSRYESALPEGRVKCAWGSTAIEHLRHRLGCAPSVTFAKVDRTFASVVATRARKSKSDLLIYSHYAWEAFTARYSYTPRKVLFQFHPHIDMERRILLEDAAKYPVVRRSYEEETGRLVSEELRRRSRDSWQYADIILCASSFTRQSLLEAGAEPNRCKIVPYGINGLESADEDARCSDRFTALFVGTGNQRKGLHHLLMAWQKANLPSDSCLILVCRYIDPEIEGIANSTKSVRLIRGVNSLQLKKLFKSSSLFVMPSLVEGFGQVYLEAMANGCPVLGTPNTGLPDLYEDGDPIWQVEPGRIDRLVAVIESLSRALPGDSSVRRQAQACAMRWSWTRFREGIRGGLQLV